MASEENGNKYAETEEILKEVVGLFSLKSDPSIVRDAGRAIVELHATAEKRHSEMLHAMKELSSSVQNTQKQHKALEETARQCSEQQAQLRSEQQQVEQRLERQRGENVSLKEQISSSELGADELSSREQQVRHQESVEVPRARHTISLFANISSIRWDYSSKLVKGFITSANGAGMKAFEVDPSQHSRFDVTNHLWELMEAP